MQVRSMADPKYCLDFAGNQLSIYACNAFIHQVIKTNNVHFFL